MKHKRTILILAALGLAMVLIGCTKNTQAEPTTLPSSASITAAPPSLTIIPTNEDKVPQMLKKISWLRSTHPYGHTCVLIRNGDQSIYIDPVDLMNITQLPKADIIFITHDHPDHFSKQTVASLSDENTKVISIEGIIHTLGNRANTVTLAPGEKVNLDNLEAEGHAAYNDSHPKASGYLGLIVKIDDVRIYFSSDTSLNPEIEGLSDIDIAVLNVRKPYSLSGEDVVKFGEIVKPKVIIPIHWMPDDDTYQDKEQITYIQQNLPSTISLQILELK